MNADPRLDYLRNYLKLTAAKLAFEGKLSGEGEDPVVAAANAALSGSSAIGTQLWADLKTLGGEGVSVARPIVEAFVAKAVNHGLEKGARAIGDFLSGRSSKGVSDAAARREAGKALMNLGKRR